jgi:hypothetical protein
MPEGVIGRKQPYLAVRALGRTAKGLRVARETYALCSAFSALVILTMVSITSIRNDQCVTDASRATTNARIATNNANGPTVKQEMQFPTIHARKPAVGNRASPVQQYLIRSPRGRPRLAALS